MASYREQETTEKFEKRRLPRFPVQLPVQIGHQADDLSSICTNLSRNGVSVETSTILEIGERLSVAVTLAPKEEPLRMVGQVVWSRDLGAVDPANQKIRELGIRFLRPLPVAQQYSNNDQSDEFDSASGMGMDNLPDLPPVRE